VIVPLVALLLQTPPPAPASAAAPARVIHVWLGSASPLVRGAAVRVYVEAGQDGNLVVLHRRTDGRIEVLFPKNPATDPFVRAGTYEIRGGDEQAAWVVAEPDGSGMVLAALSPDPLRFDEFVRAAAWDSAALVPTWSGADAAGSMSDIVQRMLGDGYFNYDVVTYRVAPPVYAQQDMTPQETAPAYDPYPACVDCTFIGEQLVFYERVLGRRHFRREPDREPRQQPMRGLALALGPRSTEHASQSPTPMLFLVGERCGRNSRGRGGSPRCRRRRARGPRAPCARARWQLPGPVRRRRKGDHRASPFPERPGDIPVVRRYDAKSYVSRSVVAPWRRYCPTVKSIRFSTVPAASRTSTCHAPVQSAGTVFLLHVRHGDPPTCSSTSPTWVSPWNHTWWMLAPSAPATFVQQTS